MDYISFKQYHQSLPKDLVHLDCIDPSVLAGRLPLSQQPGQSVPTEGMFTRKGEGVVQLLGEVCDHFFERGYSLSAPKGAWPVYYDFLQYSSDNNASVSVNNLGKGLPDLNNHILLLSNPLIPDGRYLAKDELMRIDAWLMQDPTRWLFLDVAGDYLFRGMSYRFKSANVVYFGSRTKLEACKGQEGWALTRSDLLPAFEPNGQITISPMAKLLQDAFDKVWAMLRESSALEEYDWVIPEAGFMTVIDEHYEYLREKGIAVVPGSVFGFPNDKVSVMSCLHFVPGVFKAR